VTVTELLAQWSNGDQSALEQLMPLVYAELHRMARRYMAGQAPEHTLQTTALIHEAYLRLADVPGKQWKNREHFFGVAASAMRHVLVDYARSTQSAKRGGAQRIIPLEGNIEFCRERLSDVVALDDAMRALEKLSPRQSKVVELRFFGGLSVEESAHLLQVSQETVMRDWRAAKAWLHRELSRA